MKYRRRRIQRIVGGRPSPSMWIFCTRPRRIHASMIVRVTKIARDVKDLVTFGNGPHFCIGAHLARAELRCMLDAILDFLPPAARLREDLQELSQAGIFRRPANLPVDFGPPAAPEPPIRP